MMAGLSRPGWLVANRNGLSICQPTITHSSTNEAQHWLTPLTRPTMEAKTKTKATSAMPISRLQNLAKN